MKEIVCVAVTLEDGSEVFVDCADVRRGILPPGAALISGPAWKPEPVRDTRVHEVAGVPPAQSRAKTAAQRLEDALRRAREDRLGRTFRRGRAAVDQFGRPYVEYF